VVSDENVLLLLSIVVVSVVRCCTPLLFFPCLYLFHHVTLHTSKKPLHLLPYKQRLGARQVFHQDTPYSGSLVKLTNVRRQCSAKRQVFLFVFVDISAKTNNSSRSLFSRTTSILHCFLHFPTQLVYRKNLFLCKCLVDFHQETSQTKVLNGIIVGRVLTCF
jgi:hypothetical protein